MSGKGKPFVIELSLPSDVRFSLGSPPRLAKRGLCIDKRLFFKVAITHELPSNRLLGLDAQGVSRPVLDCGVGLTSPCARQRVCCAISRATGKASSPSRSLRRQASCRARRNPVSPPSTNLSQGEQRDASRFVRVPNPVELNNHECLFWKKRWYLILSVNAFFDGRAQRLSKAAQRWLNRISRAVSMIERGKRGVHIRHLLSRREGS